MPVSVLSSFKIISNFCVLSFKSCHNYNEDGFKSFEIETILFYLTHFYLLFKYKYTSETPKRLKFSEVSTEASMYNRNTGVANACNAIFMLRLKTFQPTFVRRKILLSLSDNKKRSLYTN